MQLNSMNKEAHKNYTQDYNRFQQKYMLQQLSKLLSKEDLAVYKSKLEANEIRPEQFCCQFCQTPLPLLCWR